ncbi:MAG TPA: tRNA (adenosine(37)-N6)-threonylcarbamoyltransferase complex transferase subunit TsaD, partial [Ktedonobacterales bacterium]|nr:tRNA (adenosine(37)-N6)-threonylcarbamoyltransferase complex transferase subunit TsaD [Ktedonobacterales bacterium]
LQQGEQDDWPGDPQFPLLALVISGAHSELVSIPRHGRYELLGQTRDDAAGEAFDKVARLLGLGYPGGPAVERVASQRDATRPNPYRLPRAWLKGSYDFSFSGLKTATLEIVEGALAAQSAETANASSDVAGHARASTRGSRYRRAGASAEGRETLSIPDLAEAFQESVVDVLATKTTQAAQALGVRQVLLAGGVAANLALRERLTKDLTALGIALRYPPVALCTDNAAMIGAAAYFHLRLGERNGLDLDVRPNLQLPFATGV